MSSAPEPYVPFTAQQGLRPFEVLSLDEHVKPHLAPYLWEWCEDRFKESPERLDRMARRLRLVLENSLLTRPLEDLCSKTVAMPDLLLDVSDWLVAEGDVQRVQVQELDQILSESASAWTADPESRTLTRRVPREEEESFRSAIAAGDSTTEHLAKA